MPCWNAASTIDRALGSVLAEREVPLECIVIDDGSTDGTADLVEAMAERDPRIVLLRVPANEGVSNARNRGLGAACGEWLAFHDADDQMLPGGIAALMRSTSDPAVAAVIGQRVWSDGERTWLSPLYDIPDIREPGRKSIATHPGLLYYASVTGKAYHRSLLDGLRFEGRVLGDQAWTIKALLRAGNGIEVIDDTVFEWSRPHPDRFVATITSISRSSATGSIEMATVARTVYRDVCAEVDVRISDAQTREAIKLAYFDRLVRSDMGNAIRPAIERRDPATGQLFDAIAAFLEVVPRSILAASDFLVSDLVQWPAWNWATLVPSARPGYWRMVRVALRADRTMSRRIATVRGVEPAYLLARLEPPLGPMAASAFMSFAAFAYRVLLRLRVIRDPRAR